MFYDQSLISHIRAVKECLKHFDARTQIDIETLKLNVRARGRSIELLPQFVARRNDGTLAYTPRLLPDVSGFLGWRPYFNRVWPAAVDKLVFKQICETSNLPTPKRYSRTADVDAGVLIKRSRSSFGVGIIGPLTPSALRASDHSMSDGDFLEEFIRGDIAKIWYWNDQPVSIDVSPMPRVTGDGKSTVRHLIAKKRSGWAATGKATWDVWECVVRYQGLSLEYVVPNGQSVFVDYRFNSNLHLSTVSNLNSMANLLEGAVGQQLQKAGKIFWQLIPDQIRQDTLYTIDAMIDENQVVKFLEMNCNPLVHTDVYKAMFDSLLGASNVTENSATEFARSDSLDPRSAGAGAR